MRRLVQGHRVIHWNNETGTKEGGKLRSVEFTRISLRLCLVTPQHVMGSVYCFRQCDSAICIHPFALKTHCFRGCNAFYSDRRLSTIRKNLWANKRIAMGPVPGAFPNYIPPFPYSSMMKMEVKVLLRRCCAGSCQLLDACRRS